MRKKISVPYILDAIRFSKYVSIKSLGVSKVDDDKQASPAMQIYQLHLSSGGELDLDTVREAAARLPRETLEDVLIECGVASDTISVLLSGIGEEVPTIPVNAKVKTLADTETISPAFHWAQSQFAWSKVCCLDYIAPNADGHHKWINTTDGVIIEFFVDFVPWSTKDIPPED